MVAARRTPRGYSLPPVRIEWADLTEYNRLGGRLTEKTMACLLCSWTEEQISGMKISKTLRFTKCVTLRLGESKMIRRDRRPGCLAGTKGKVLQDASMKAH